MKTKRRRAQAAAHQFKKYRRDSLENDDRNVELGNVSSDSESSEDYFKDDQRFHLEDNVEEVLPITNDDDDDDDEEESGDQNDGDIDEEKEGGDQEDRDIDEERDSGDDGNLNYEKNEVLGPYSSTSEEEEEDDHLEAWGNRKRNFFSTNFVDEDRGRSYREDDREIAKAEEDAAMAIHQTFVNDLYTSASCFTLDKEFLRDGESTNDNNLELAGPDWKVIDKKDKLHVLQKQSPEFIPIMRNFRNKMVEFKNRILPLVRHLKKVNATDEPYTKYITLKSQLLLNYCMNASFYMASKSLNVPMARHPLIKTLDKYNKLLNRLQVLDVKLNPLIDEMLKNIEQTDVVSQGLSNIFSNKEQTSVISEKSISENLILENGKSTKNTKDKKKVHFETEAEKEVLDSYMKIKEQERKAFDQLEDDDEIKEDDDENGEENSLDTKRSISYQIKKNKGLIPHRKKEYRNPRVRNRMKFKKAQIRRKGQVRLPRKELKKYSGEITGISSHVTKSVKIK